MKKLIMLVMFLSIGCSPGNPVPEKAIKDCLDKGGIPHYRSTGCDTIFECTSIPRG